MSAELIKPDEVEGKDEWRARGKFDNVRGTYGTLKQDKERKMKEKSGSDMSNSLLTKKRNFIGWLQEREKTFFLWRDERLQIQRTGQSRKN